MVREIGRREFLTVLGAAGALAACGSSQTRGVRGVSVTPPISRARLPHPSEAPFDTVVVLMMENRSFDHLLGWMPAADGRQAGLAFADRAGTTRATHSLAGDYQGCGFHDPRHDWRSVATQYNNGHCDGWLKTQAVGDTFPIGYYTAADVPVSAALARGYTVCDRYHCSVLGPTGPNRMYAWCATTDYLEFDGILNGQGRRPSNIQLTIFDRLREARVPAAYYAGTEPQSYAFASKKYDALTLSHSDFFEAARSGTLPRVAFIDPDLDSIAEFAGTATDDHPYGDIRQGEAWIARVYGALAGSPQWGRIVFVVTFDEHGGFFDHVAPPVVADDTQLQGPGPDLKRLGFRVPCIVAGPFASPRVDHTGPYEHCSILRMIEWRWGLDPMTARDRGAANLAQVLDFSRPSPPVEFASLSIGMPTACSSAQAGAHVQP